MTVKHKDERETAVDFLPDVLTLPALKEAAARCQGCPLWERGTQTVFGDGLVCARLVLVGEQPGDSEDRQGLPFVGPAGRVLDRALEAAGIERKEAYVTNAVKHFKWVPKGKLRLHQKPNAREISACFPWLEKEIELIRPRVIVAMGATAAQALFGSKVKVLRDRGTFIHSDLAPRATVTIHPSSILRARTDDQRHAAMDGFIADLLAVADALND